MIHYDKFYIILITKLIMTTLNRTRSSSVISKVLEEQAYLLPNTPRNEISKGQYVSIDHTFSQGKGMTQVYHHLYSFERVICGRVACNFVFN